MSILSTVEQAAVADIEHMCPVCERKSVRLEDLTDDGLGYKWACRNCGWSEC